MDSDDLSAKLRAWRVEPELPASFQRGVWQRIATRQAMQETAFWPRDMSWIGVEGVHEGSGGVSPCDAGTRGLGGADVG